MYQKFFEKKVVMATAVSMLLLFESCAGQGDTSTKCIDNKPAPTPFSTTLNAINHSITLAEAMAMINNFSDVRETLPVAIMPGVPNVLPVYETFNLKTIDAILCQDNVVGLRIYLAMDNQNQVRFVLTGVNPQGEDAVQRGDAPGYTPRAEDKVYEAGQRWP